MNKQTGEQVNSVLTDNELNRTEFQNNLKQHQTSNRTNKLNNNKLNERDKIINNNNSVNEQQIRTSTTKKKLTIDQIDNNHQIPITSNLNNSSSYQNDNSVYYTPVYNHQNTKQTNINHKSSIESTNQINGVMNCSFDNSIVPIASSSVSSRRSSISSCHLPDNQCNSKHHHRKKSTNLKKTKDELNDNNHKLNYNQKNHSTSRHLSGHHQRKQRILKSERNHYHNLESSNELDSKFLNENELTNQTSDYKHYHHQTITDDNQHHHNNQATELFEHLSDRNPTPLSEDDSLPYFQTSSFSQEVCNKLRWKLKYHLSNPIEKWQHKRKFPFKLLLQIIKIIFVTIHVLTYGSTMARFLTHQGN